MKCDGMEEERERETERRKVIDILKHHSTSVGNNIEILRMRNKAGEFLCMRTHQD